MVDYTGSKAYPQKTYPVEASNTSSLLSRTEELLTPQKMKDRYLQGIDLSDYSEYQLKDRIEMAINDVEVKLGVPLMKLQFKERLPYDRDKYRSFLFVKLHHGPVLSVDKFEVESSDGHSIFTVPPQWIEIQLAHTRQINIVPLLQVFGTSNITGGAEGNAGLVFIKAINNFHWMPSFWSVTYTAGICKEEGQVPVLVNDLIGITAAIELLGQKQNQFKWNSQSIGQDGISQSKSGQGTQTYQNRINMLTQDRDAKLEKLKGVFHRKFFMGHI